MCETDFAKSWDFAKSLTQNRNREKNDFAKSLTPKPKSRNQWNASKTNNIVSILSKLFTISYLFCREIQKLFSSLWAMFSIQMYLPRSSLYSRTVEKVGTVGTSTVRVQYWILVLCWCPVSRSLYSSWLVQYVVLYVRTSTYIFTFSTVQVP